MNWKITSRAYEGIWDVWQGEMHFGFFHIKDEQLVFNSYKPVEIKISDMAYLAKLVESFYDRVA